MSSAIIESFEYMVIYENREDRSAATSMKPQKNSTFYSAAQWDLWSWNRNSPFHPWPHKSTFPEVLEKWPRTKWKANIAGVSHCSKILNFVQKNHVKFAAFFGSKSGFSLRFFRVTYFIQIKVGWIYKFLRFCQNLLFVQKLDLKQSVLCVNFGQ